MTVQITIINMPGAQAPDFPSHLFPGAGSDAATFRVTLGEAPSPEILAQLLGGAIMDACLVDYDQATGEGGFFVVDGDAPATGTVLTLGDETCPAAGTAQAAAVTRSQSSPATPTIEQFYDDLDRHDWYFSFSDNSQVYRNGTENVARIEAIVRRLGGDHAALYAAFEKHHFSGEPWSTPKWDKPARPLDGVLVLPDAPERADAVPEQPGASTAAERAETSLQITILRYQFTRVPDSPMFTCSGALHYAVSFQVTQGQRPTYEEMFERLACTIADSELERYNPWTGEGILTTQNAEFPRDGDVIELPPLFERPPEWYRLESDDYTIEDFYDALNCHDWYAGLSDDRRVAWRGELHLARLSTVATRRGGDYAVLFEAFRNHYFSGSRPSTRTCDKPVRPVNGALVPATAPCWPGRQVDGQGGSEISGASAAPRETGLVTHADHTAPSRHYHHEAYETQRRFARRADALASLERKVKAWFAANQALADLIYPARGRFPARQPGLFGAWRTWSALTTTRRSARHAVAQAEADLRMTARVLAEFDRTSRDEGTQR
ncbi:hypothetical protein [Burkholderia gladioli]|uniref:hypothetical protein n=1 Tax=Burkholderia gladioli TaxID=28095 RepID=UPI00163F7C0F|nr:hypothetical protein [Burkholderia gladioli]MDN7465965.1 hypothetical protein [Burkholderia gladioli]